ncbi:glycosyltransferase family 39 protein, partial [Patescibacteria group bacterium]|nr:glycosyltransferase family 39 protein [Patescibacteria group bacterium]
MRKLFLPFLIILIASPLYFYKLSQIPPAFYVDESTVAYNSYSILKTGKDEYGQVFPIAFKLLGSYTPPLFIYLLVPFIKIFDLTILATRFPNALLGLLTGFTLYFLAKRLKINPVVTLTLFLISPWNIFFARLGYEIYLGFSLFCLSAFLFYSSLKNQKLILPAYFVLSLSSYTSHPQRILAPVFLLLFLITYKKYLDKKHHQAL